MREGWEIGGGGGADCAGQFEVFFCACACLC